MFKIDVFGERVRAENIHSNAVRWFKIETTNCEFNGLRDYLVEEKERYRVRLKSRTESGFNKAIKHYAEGYLDCKLYKHP